jgi:hypothetical protein
MHVASLVASLIFFTQIKQIEGMGAAVNEWLPLWTTNPEVPGPNPGRAFKITETLFSVSHPSRDELVRNIGAMRRECKRNKVSIRKRARVWYPDSLVYASVSLQPAPVRSIGKFTQGEVPGSAGKCKQSKNKSCQ